MPKANGRYAPKPADKPDPAHQLLTLQDAAARLAVCTKTLRKMIANQQLKAFKLGFGRGLWRIPASEVNRLISAGSDSYPPC